MLKIYEKCFKNELLFLRISQRCPQLHHIPQNRNRGSSQRRSLSHLLARRPPLLRLESLRRVSTGADALRAHLPSGWTAAERPRQPRNPQVRPVFILTPTSNGFFLTSNFISIFSLTLPKHLSENSTIFVAKTQKTYESKAF